MTSKLHNLAGPGKSLAAEPPDRAEFVGLGPEVWRILAKAHDLRNVSEYEGDLNVNERLVTDLVTATQAVAAAVGRLALP